MAGSSADEIRVHLEYIRDGIDGINERLDALNGRTRKTETAIAVLQDRTTDTRAAKVAGSKYGAAIGAAVSAIVSGLLAAYGGSK